MGANGSVWGLNSSNAIYSFNQQLTLTQTFHPVSGATLVQIATSLDGNAWGIGPAGKLSGYNLATQSWTRFNPGEVFAEVASRLRTGRVGARHESDRSSTSIQ